MRVIALLTAAMSAQAALAQEAELPTVVVAPIKQLSPIEGIAMLTEELRTQVARHGKYQLVTPEEMAAVDGELRRQLEGGCDDTSCVAEIGGALGAQFVITGQIGKLGRIYSLNLKLVDIETVAAKQAASARASSVEDFLEKMPAVVEDLLGEGLRKKMKAKAKGKSKSLLGAGIATLNALTDGVQERLGRERAIIDVATSSSQSEPVADATSGDNAGAKISGFAARLKAEKAKWAKLRAKHLRQSVLGGLAIVSPLAGLRYEWRPWRFLQFELDVGPVIALGVRAPLVGRLDQGGSLNFALKSGGLIVPPTGPNQPTINQPANIATIAAAYKLVTPTGFTFLANLGLGQAYVPPGTRMALVEAALMFGKSF